MSLLLTVPVFLTYHLGILFMDFRNGVDWVTGLTFELLERSVSAYVAVTCALSLGLAIVAYVQRSRGRIRPAALVPVLLESAGWAVLMAYAVGWATARLTPSLQIMGGHVLAVSVQSGMGPLDKIVMAAGAGFHEEVIFRVLLLGGLVRLFSAGSRTGTGTGLAGWARCGLAMLVTSLLFSWAHHVGALGDAFSLGAFAFRFLAGLYLCLVYVLRGFAIVVYTHTLYDVLVFFVLAR